MPEPMKVNIFTLMKNVLVMKDSGLVVIDAEANGKPYKIGFPLAEAMKLLGALQAAQRTLGLPLPDQPLQFVDVPPEDRRN